MIREFQQTLESQLKTFDPRDVTDLAHFKSLRFDGKQGCRRYIVEHPFPDVMSMMLHKIAVAYLKDSKQYTASELARY
jgi:hypothetical protein